MKVKLGTYGTTGVLSKPRHGPAEPVERLDPGLPAQFPAGLVDAVSGGPREQRDGVARDIRRPVPAEEAGDDVSQQAAQVGEGRRDVPLHPGQPERVAEGVEELSLGEAAFAAQVVGLPPR